MFPLYDDTGNRNTPIATMILILINAYVFIVWQEHIGVDKSVHLAGFIPNDYTAKVPGASTRMITSMFMHGGWMHLITNMWFLWVFGRGVEAACGFFRYLAFYLITGAAATYVYGLFSPHSTLPLVGASGAISGVLGAYLMQHPKARILTLIPVGLGIIPVPAWFFLFIWIGYQIYSQLHLDHTPGQETGGVAYLVHIGGFIAGMGLLFFFEKPAPKGRDRER